MLKDLGVYVETLRDGKGWTQTRLADESGVAFRTLNRWENEGIKGFSNELVKVIQAVGGTLGDAELVLAEDANEETARNVARARLTAGAAEQLTAGVEGLSVEDMLLTITALQDRPDVWELVKALLGAALKQKPRESKKAPAE